MKTWNCPLRVAILSSYCLFLQAESHGQTANEKFFRVSRISNFEFSILNDGSFFGSFDPFAPVCSWPRGNPLRPSVVSKGPLLITIQDGQLKASGPEFVRPSFFSTYPFSETVPGRVGDQNAGYDSTFGGAGWKFVADRDYIVYSSLDYDSLGIDVSGSNFNDWPIREVDGAAQFVPDPLQRARYEPVFHSDEDMFCVFKDTESRAHETSVSLVGKTEPIGLEFHCYVRSWQAPPGDNIVVFEYEIHNRSVSHLDSCYFVFGSGISIGRPGIGSDEDLIVGHKTVVDSQRANLCYWLPTNPEHWASSWPREGRPPTFGLGLLETSYESQTFPRLAFGVSESYVNWFADTSGIQMPVILAGDSVVYRRLTSPEFFDLAEPNRTSEWPYQEGTVVSTGPFMMAPDESVRIALALIFSDSLSHLLLMHDYITRVYDNNFARPAPPPSPELTAVGLNRSVKLSWDNKAESATDIIIPDSLGRPFVGYKLLRATTRDGPYTELARWHTDTLLVYEYLDTGEDLDGGIKNNVTYYYQLLSYDEGAPLLKLDPMDSPPVEGVNFVEVIPTTEPADATSESSDGSVVDGTLGAATAPVLIPRNTTNFNRLLSGRDLTLRLSAASNGLRYTLPVTITDSISGRVHNDVVDPDLLVHGSSEVAGVRSGTATIEDVFDVGAADITFDYTFEQLSEPFHIASSIEG
ncbi:MAG: hypothetical protein OEV30_12295, partial [Ignavibacteria bacterium]|nr:hypothetical protein [Ignavibacteria bacterium]